MPSIDQFAVILFTLRDHIRTREDALKSFDKVAEIGYKSVQVSGMDQSLFPEEELRDLLLERGISICATHEPSAKIIEDTDAVISRLQRLGVTYTAYPSPHVDLGDESVIDGWLKDLDTAAKKMADAGQVLTYHNHANEFMHSRGEIILDRIYNETCLQAEIDIHWVQRGGGTPLAWVEKMSGRQPLIHLKDFKVEPNNTPMFAELGQGNLPLKEIVAAAEKGGCKHFIVEQDVCPGDPFDSIATSFDYIQSELAD